MLCELCGDPEMVRHINECLAIRGFDSMGECPRCMGVGGYPDEFKCKVPVLSDGKMVKKYYAAKTRMKVLHMIEDGQTAQEVFASTGVKIKTVRQWVRMRKAGNLDELGRYISEKPPSKWTPERIAELKHMREVECLTLKELADRFDSSPDYICRLLRGKR